MKIPIKHIDGKTIVKAKVGLVINGEVNLEYRFEGMTYGRTITQKELQELINKKPHEAEFAGQ